MATKSITAQDEALVVGGGLKSGRTVGFQLSGTFSATVTFESTINGTDWVATGAFPISGSGTAATTANATGIWRVPAQGLAAVRARCSTYSSGTLVVDAETSEVAL